MSNSPFVDQGLYPLVVGISNSPFTDQRAVAGAIVPPVDLNSLDLSYDTENSVLILSDPLLINPFISATTIVTGRTVLISDVNTNVLFGQAESVIGLSNTIFNPPPPSTHLIGNNPPSVLYPNQFSGLTSWFSGGSFRATAGGTIAKLSNNKLLTCTIWSNRGQPTQVKLNEFTLKLDSVSGSSGLGWSWDIIFTCRSINMQFSPLGSVATNSRFSYTDDRFSGSVQPEGFIVSNITTNNFNTDINQYLDFTFNFSDNTNGLITNLFIIERIY